MFECWKESLGETVGWVREFIEVETCNRLGHGKSQGKSKKLRGRELWELNLLVERDLAFLLNQLSTSTLINFGSYM